MILFFLRGTKATPALHTYHGDSKYQIRVDDFHSDNDIEYRQGNILIECDSLQTVSCHRMVVDRNQFGWSN